MREAVNTTVRAGMLMPMEKVSVANRIFRSDSWNRISMTCARPGGANKNDNRSDGGCGSMDRW